MKVPSLMQRYNPACVRFTDCHDLSPKYLGIGRLFSAKQIFLYFLNQCILFGWIRIHMLSINLQSTYVKMLFYKRNLTSFKPSEYFFFFSYALGSILTLEDIRHGIKGN